MKFALYLLILLPLFMFSQPPGNGLAFDGNSDYYTVTDNSSIDLTGNFTIEAWINPCDTSGHRMILSKQWCSGNQFSFYFSILNGKLKWAWNTIGTCSGNAINSYESSSRIIRNNTWQHVAIVHTPTSVAFYYNSVQVSGSLVAGVYSGNLYSSTAPLRVGAYRALSGSFDHFFNGRLDEIRIWNSALSASQISSRYINPLTGTETNLKLYHNFESVNGFTINNSCISTGSINDGTNTRGFVSTRTNSFDYPRAFSLGNDTTLCDSNILTLTIPIVYSGYLWSDGTTSNINTFNASGTYIGSAFRDYCFTSDTISVTLIDCDTTRIDTTEPIEIDSCQEIFLMPNVFSPNGDGINDVFFPIQYDCFKLVSFNVYNRWGKLIYESPKEIYWYGFNSEGKKVNEGTYYWVIQHIDQFGKEKNEKGFLTIFN